MAQSSKVTPNALAASLSKSLRRNVTAKAVRTVARSVLSAYSKAKHPAYQSHEYDAAMVRAITAAFRARGTRTASAATAKVGPVRKRRTAPKATATVEA